MPCRRDGCGCMNVIKYLQQGGRLNNPRQILHLVLRVDEAVEFLDAETIQCLKRGNMKRQTLPHRHYVTGYGVY